MVQGGTITLGAAGLARIGARGVTAGVAVPATVALGDTIYTAVYIRATAGVATARGRTRQSTCRKEIVKVHALEATRSNMGMYRTSSSQAAAATGSTHVLDHHERARIDHHERAVQCANLSDTPRITLGERSRVGENPSRTWANLVRSVNSFGMADQLRIHVPVTIHAIRRMAATRLLQDDIICSSLAQR